MIAEVNEEPTNPFEVLRDAVRQVSLALQCAERQLTPEWRLATSWNLAKTQGSQLLDRPGDWVPTEVFRFYQPVARPQVLAYVAAVLASPDDEQYEVVTPLMTAGWFDFGKLEVPNEIAKVWFLWYSRSHMYHAERVDDGSWHEAQTADWNTTEHTYLCTRVRTLGSPLFDIRDDEALRQRIVEPLLGDVRTYTGT